jgi:ubiquinone/menaquinone biosynthesis C-methylase UbiE
MDIENFRAFEHAGWVNVPQQYHQAWGNLTSQTIPALLDAVGVKAGIKLLDIATGPGYVAGAAAQRGAQVLAVDFSSAMIAQARQIYPEVDFREGDAEQLPFAAEIFDAGVMNFGILHLARPDEALREGCRVLKSGGRFAFTAWAPPEETVGFRIVLRAIQEHGTLDVQLPEGPPFFRFGNPEESVRSLTEAGFTSPQVVKVPQLWRLPVRGGLFEAMKESTVRTAGLLRSQSPKALARIADAIRAGTEPYRKGDVLDLPMPAVLASGTKK